MRDCLGGRDLHIGVIQEEEVEKEKAKKEKAEEEKEKLVVMKGNGESQL